MNMSHLQKVTDLLNSIETGNPAPMACIHPHTYIQHNPGIADGLQGFKALLQQLPPGSAKVKVVRAFEDGNFVFTHSEYEFFGPKIGFDIFRFEDGWIVEHWDNLQETAGPNPSGRSMTDGPTEARDLGRTDANKALIRKYAEEILVQRNMEHAPAYYDGDRYLQHNPMVGDNFSGISKALQEWASQGITMEYHRVHHILGQGNFVLAASEGALAGKPTAFYDLFRIENGKIAEHWDTIEAIPPAGEWKNSNGKF